MAESEGFVVYDTNTFALARDPQGRTLITFEDDSAQILLSRTLGRGAFSKVKFGLRTFTDESGRHEDQYAVKKMHKLSLEKNRCSVYDDEGIPAIANNLEKVRMEISIWRQLCHPNVVRLYEVLDSAEEDYMFLILEYADSGQIMTWDTAKQRYVHSAALLSALSGPLEAVARFVFRQVAEALLYLHTLPRPVIHRDVKPDNILYTSKTHQVKLTDFTVARQLPTAEALCWDSAGTTAFLAPESMISGTPYSGQKFDAWAMGVSLYAFMSEGKLPFWDPEHELHMQLMIQNDEPEYQTGWSEPLDKLVKGLLCKDPERRTTLEEFLASSWHNE